jgi:hypothetical protein
VPGVSDAPLHRLSCSVADHRAVKPLVDMKELPVTMMALPSGLLDTTCLLRIA